MSTRPPPPPPAPSAAPASAAASARAARAHAVAATPPSAPATPVHRTVVSVGSDWLGERLLDRRIGTVSGPLTAEATNRAAASLALLDASGDDPIQLRLLQQRLADACHRPLDTVMDDLRAGRVLTAEQARDYGIVDAVASAH
jgi:ATP-dependent protease ClpP protease subunit